MTTKLEYINNNGNTVSLSITSHARRRFQQRYSHVYPKRFLYEADIDAEIIEVFCRADRVRNISSREIKRFEKHGKDTVLFRETNFTFVIQNATIVTIELCSKGMRHLNKKFPVLFNQQNSNEMTEPANLLSTPTFKLTAYALDEEGQAKKVNLGSYISNNPDVNIENLCDDEKFVTEIHKRFSEKRNTWNLCSVYAHIGKNGEYFKILEEMD